MNTWGGKWPISPVTEIGWEFTYTVLTFPFSIWIHGVGIYIYLLTRFLPEVWIYLYLLTRFLPECMGFEYIYTYLNRFHTVFTGWEFSYIYLTVFYLDTHYIWRGINNFAETQIGWEFVWIYLAVFHLDKCGGNLRTSTRLVVIHHSERSSIESLLAAVTKVISS